MNVLDLANLAPQELLVYLDGAIGAGRLQAPTLHTNLAPAYSAALDRAAVATAKVRVWAARRAPKPVATDVYRALNNFGQKSRPLARNNADTAAPTDEYSPGIAEALSALAEAGALLTRSATGQVATEESAAINRAKTGRTS